MWYLYLIRCEDGSLYTGVTRDVLRRFEEHRTGRGAKYTRSHKPIAVVYTEAHDSQRAACVREAEIKRWSREKKCALVAAG